MDAAHQPPSAVSSSRVIRGLSIAAGLGCVAIGVLGVVLPGLPASPLFIASVWFFSRSSPRLERWVLGLPGVGQLVADHRSGLGVPARVKVVAIAMMAVAVGASAVTLRTRPPAATRRPSVSAVPA